MRFHDSQGSPAELDSLDYNDSTWDKPWNQYRGQITSAERMPSFFLEVPGRLHPLRQGEPFPVDEVRLTDNLTGRPIGFTDFLQRRIFNDGLLITHRGVVVYEGYLNGMSETDRHLCHSVTKSLTTMHIGIAVHEGKLGTDTLVRDIVTELSALPAWDFVTVQHLLDMATGIASDEHYEDLSSMYYDYAHAVGYWGKKPNMISALDFAVSHLTDAECAPGTKFNYASYNTNLFPIILERVYGRPAVELYETSLFHKVGPECGAIINADPGGQPLVEGHLNLTLRDLYRWGYLFHSGGKNLEGEQVIPAEWVTETLSDSGARRSAFQASDYADVFPGAQYHNQMWVLDANKGISAMLGIHGQFFYSDRSRDITVNGFSSYPDLAPIMLSANMRQLWDAITTTLTTDSP